MTKAVCMSLYAMLFISVVDFAAMARQKVPISRLSFELMIQSAPLVLQGKITQVEVKLITPRELDGTGSSTARIPVTNVTMKIEKIIAGEYDGDHIVIVLQEGKTEGATRFLAGQAPMKVNVGDNAIVALELDSWGIGLNILDQDWRFFRVEGAKLIPYREEIYLAVDNPLEVMAEKAKEREIQEMQDRQEIFKASDLICTATVTRLIDLDSPSGKLVASVDETLKGKAEQSEIMVDMSDAVLPSKLRGTDVRVVLFLKRDGSGYRPVPGSFGYYLTDGERIRGRPFRMSISHLKSILLKLKGAE